jgi:hypothetical protein
MSDPDTTATASRIGVIDLGSNSLRLVVFERLGGALFPLLNEKVMCALGRGITSTGRLNQEGVTLALVNLRRFVALARALGIEHLAVLATAAVRDAIDGRSFAAEVEHHCHVPVKIVEGGEEARLSAAGVLAGIPDADGVVCDLGGGSVELVRLGADSPSRNRADRSGHNPADRTAASGRTRRQHQGHLRSGGACAPPGHDLTRRTRQKSISGRRGLAGYCSAAHGAYPLSAPHRSPVHDWSP